MIDLGIKACSDTTDYIEANGQQVTQREFIDDFYKNAESEVIRLLQTRLQELTQEAKIKPFNLQCENCFKEYQAELSFDYASFFAQGF